MGIAVLGPLQIDGGPARLSPRDRVVLSALAVEAGAAVTTGALADALWGDSVPPSGAKVVQGCVVRLRKQLGAAAIESGSFGYRLALNEDELDHLRFLRLVAQAEASLAGDDPDRASYLVREALDLWRGDALVDLEEWAPGQVEATRLEGVRMDAEELEVEAAIRSGHARTVLDRAQALVPRAPFRERRWALLAMALHQAGRQAEALGAVRRARTLLAEEFGLDPGRDLIELEQRLLRQDPSLAPLVAPEASATCPYRGLLPYHAEDADRFFGRDDDVAACLRRLRDSRVLAVIGPSGVGKSSLVRAGVVAALLRSGTPVLVTVPGVHPVDSLVDLKPRGRQTLVADQAEEAVTLCGDQEERERYFAALAAHVGSGGALVLSLRADHLGDLAPYPDIARVLEDGFYLLGPMSDSDLRSAIAGPARSAGLRLEPGLVDLLVNEVDGEPAALPMLSHVLRSTWEQREGPTLTLDGYKKTGGIRHAISQSAESLYDAMDETQRAQLRNLLLRLVMPSEEGHPVRARVPRDKVVADATHQRLVERLVDARLVSIDGDTVQIAHEALVRVWPRLRGWLEDDVDGQRLFRHLAGAADAWEGMGRPDSELYRGARLNRTLEWRDRAAPDLREPEEEFLAASVALSESELWNAQARVLHQRRVNRRLSGALAAVGVMMVLTLLAGLVALRTADQAGRDRDRAQASAVLADARRAGAQALVLPDAEVALLLAASALGVEQSPEAHENLADALMRNPSLLAVRDAGGVVVDLTASPDGSILAASRPGVGEGLHLIDATTLESLPFEDGIPASGLAFSPDSTRLAMAVNQWNGEDPPRLDPQPVRLYDMPDGTLADQQLGGFPAGSFVEYALDFSADGSRLVAAVQHLDAATGDWAPGAVATVWDLADPRRPMFRVRLPSSPSLELSPDGRRLYVALSGEDLDRPVRVYDVDSGRLLRATGSEILDEIGAFAADLSPDGATFAVATASEVYRYDAATLRKRGRDVEAGAGDYVDQVEFSHDGTMLAAPTRAGSVVVWDATSGAELHRFTEPRSSWAIAFAADDRTLYSSGDGRVRAWDLTGKRQLFSEGRAFDRREYAVSKPAPDGRTLVRERLGLIWFVDNRTGRETPRTPKATHDWNHVWSPDSRWLLTGRDGGVYRLWDSATARLVGSHRFADGRAVVTAFSPTGDQIYAAYPDDTSLMVLDRRSMDPARPPIDLETRVLELAPHPTDGSVFAIGVDGAALRVDPGSGRVEQLTDPGTFSADGLTVTLSPDGTRFAATAATEERMRLIDVATWDWYGPASAWGQSIQFAPDGGQIATLPTSEQVALYDGETGALEANLALPSRTPEVWIAYLPDGSGLLVAGLDGRTWTVDTRVGAWVARACRIAGRNLTRAEWREYFPSQSYRVTCPQWPAGT